MSSEVPEKKIQPATEEREFGIVNLCNKALSAGNDTYNFDMKESAKARFFRIVEDNQQSRRNRIVVPMVIAHDFIQKLEEFVEFTTKFEPPKAPETPAGKDQAFLHTVSLVSASKRRYYFDLLVNESQQLVVRMSYVFSERRDIIHMLVDALPTVIEILKDFCTRFPARPNEKDIPPRQNFNRRNWNDNRGRGNFEGRRGGFTATQSNPANGSNPVDRERRGNLRVLEDPAPSSVTVNAKKFTFEIVEGTNTFMRVTEIINNNRKSTLHVPVEACAEIQKIIGDMISKISLAPKTTTPEQV